MGLRRGDETVYMQPSEGCERKLVEVQILSSAQNGRRTIPQI